jgi:hypothetical protein
MKDALRSTASNWKAESRSRFVSSWPVIASQPAHGWANEAMNLRIDELTNCLHVLQSGDQVPNSIRKFANS